MGWGKFLQCFCICQVIQQSIEKNIPVLKKPSLLAKPKGTQGGVQWLRGPNFALFWPPPTYSGQTWTFEVPPTPCPRGQFQNLHPQPLKCNHQYAVHFYQNYKGINMVMACKIKLYYSKSDLKYMCLIFFEGIIHTYVKAIEKNWGIILYGQSLH